jgi:hypothetical protein
MLPTDASSGLFRRAKAPMMAFSVTDSLDSPCNVAKLTGATVAILSLVGAVTYLMSARVGSLLLHADVPGIR